MTLSRLDLWQTESPSFSRSFLKLGLALKITEEEEEKRKNKTCAQTPQVTLFATTFAGGLDLWWVSVGFGFKYCQVVQLVVVIDPGSSSPKVTRSIPVMDLPL